MNGWEFTKRAASRGRERDSSELSWTRTIWWPVLDVKTIHEICCLSAGKRTTIIIPADGSTTTASSENL